MHGTDTIERLANSLRVYLRLALRGFFAACAVSLTLTGLGMVKRTVSAVQEDLRDLSLEHKESK